jgi:hypothetical protein
VNVVLYISRSSIHIRHVHPVYPTQYQACLHTRDKQYASIWHESLHRISKNRQKNFLEATLEVMSDGLVTHEPWKQVGP